MRYPVFLSVTFRRHITLIAVVLLGWVVPLARAAGDLDLPSTYRLGPGDKIQITVAEEPDLSLETTIAPSGKISYSFLGEITVEGLTGKELEKDLTRRFQDGFLRNPVVNVSITSYRMVYVNGEVSTSGGYPFRPGLTVRKAITLAGGFSDRADRERITVIRGQSSRNKEIPIHLDDPVFPDDIITVPEGFW
ncbi:MAG: polysaccharide export protein [Magnetococcales bacterium]|nr:polysaccharide export protein [Magnetococcales bacterium]